MGDNWTQIYRGSTGGCWVRTADRAEVLLRLTHQGNRVYWFINTAKELGRVELREYHDDAAALAEADTRFPADNAKGTK